MRGQARERSGTRQPAFGRRGAGLAGSGTGHPEGNRGRMRLSCRPGTDGLRDQRHYAKELVQFGRPIGSFQAIQHKAADMVTDVDGARFIMYRAAWAVAEGEPDAEMQVSMAKAWVSDA